MLTVSIHYLSDYPLAFLLWTSSWHCCWTDKRDWKISRKHHHSYSAPCSWTLMVFCPFWECFKLHGEFLEGNKIKMCLLQKRYKGKFMKWTTEKAENTKCKMMGMSKSKQRTTWLLWVDKILPRNLSGVLYIGSGWDHSMVEIFVICICQRDSRYRDRKKYSTTIITTI